MSATFASITSRMRINFFSRNDAPVPDQPATPQQGSQQAAPERPQTGRTFPADEVVWGIVIRNGFDELDDPWYHRGTTQHAYLEGNDNVAICGFRPPQSGPRTRRRSRLGLPTSGEHPMCGMCARMVVAPRPRVPVPVQPGRPAVAVPVAPGAAQPVPASVAPRAAVSAAAAASPSDTAPPIQPQAQNFSGASPWVRRAAGEQEELPPISAIPVTSSHDAGLLARGVHTKIDD